jgi:hypothetical protein
MGYRRDKKLTSGYCYRISFISHFYSCTMQKRKAAGIPAAFQNLATGSSE